MDMASKKDVLQLIQQNISFILVGTTHPGNIGAAARAMKNMGIKQMGLVSPKSFPHEKAFFRAKAATDVLEKAVVYKSLSKAVSEIKLVIGTSARNRKVPWPIVSPREAAEEIVSFSKTSENKIAVIFGREDRGLTNEELGLCNLHVHIPSSDEYPSLNLSQAIQIIAYEIRLKALSHEGKLKKQMEYANKIKSPAVILYGENEIKTGKPTLRNLVSGNEKSITTKELINEIKKII